MGTIRGVKDRRCKKFVQLVNEMFEDPNISLQAKGFIGYCLTKPESWHFHVPHLCSVLKEGRDAVYSIINECIKNGYAYRYQPRDEKGRTIERELIVSDTKEEIQTLKEEMGWPHNDYEPIPACPEAVDNQCKQSKVPHNDYSPIPACPEAVDNQCKQSKVPHNDYSPIPACPEAVKPHLSNKEERNTERQQQSAAVFFEKDSEEKKPNSYEILNSIDIPFYDKAEITNDYPEDSVNYAVRWSQQPGIEIKSLAATIKWVCKNMPEMRVDPRDAIERNKDYAAQYDGMKQKELNMYIECNNIGVFFVWACAAECPHIKYEEKKFMEKFQELLGKYRFKTMEKK